jgi:hypothetical protein
MIASSCSILYTRPTTQWFHFGVAIQPGSRDVTIWCALTLDGSANLFALCYTGVTLARQRPVWRGNA